MKNRLLFILLFISFFLFSCDSQESKPVKIVKKAEISEKEDGTVPEAARSFTTESASEPEAEAPPETGADEGVLKIGVMDDYWPYVRMYPGEKPSGFDVEVVREIMDRTGLPYEFVSVKWNKAVQDLKIGELSMLIITAVTPDRCKIYDFTDSYAAYEIVFFERENEADKISADSPDELIRALYSKKVAVPTGYSALEELRQYKKIEILEVPDDRTCFQVLLEKKADVILLGKIRGLYYIKHHHQPVSLVSPSLTEHPYSTAVFKGADRKVIEKYNKALQEIQTDGTFDRLYNRWFGEKKPVSVRLMQQNVKTAKPDRLLKIGVMNNYLPYMRMKEGKKPEGYDVEVVRKIMDRTGFPYFFVPVKWKKGLADLRIGELDMLIGAGITAERQIYLDYTDSYGAYQIVIFVREETEGIGGDTGASSLESLFGKKVAVSAGYSSHEMIRQYNDRIDIITVPHSEQAFKVLLDGGADAAPNDKLFGLHFIKTRHLPVKAVGAPFYETPYAAAVYKNIELDIIGAYNRALKEVEKEGVIDEIYFKWFGQKRSRKNLKQIP